MLSVLWKIGFVSPVKTYDHLSERLLAKSAFPVAWRAGVFRAATHRPVGKRIGLCAGTFDETISDRLRVQSQCRSGDAYGRSP